MEQKQPEKRKRGKWYALVGGVLVMLLVCFLLGVLVGQRDGEPETALRSSAASPGPASTATPSEIAEPTETAEPTRTPEPTPTATPTATPHPTITATPEPTETTAPTQTATPHPTLTATPQPTATAVSTATLTPTLTPLRWSQETGPQLEIMGDVARTMGSLLESPLPGDATWNALVAAQVVNIREVDAALRAIVPPEECREAHAMLLSSTGDFLLAVEYTVEGIQQLDPDLIAQGTEYNASAAAKMNLYRLMIEAMTP